MDFFLGVKNLQREDGHAVDHHAGCFGVQRSVVVLGGGLFDQREVDALGEVVAALVQAVDVVLHFGDDLVGGEGVARFVFAMPEVEVGVVLLEDELGECVGGDGGGQGSVMPVRVGGVVHAGYLESIKHRVHEQDSAALTILSMPTKLPRRVLVYRLGSLGDMLIALPALRLIARAFPNAERRMLTNIPVNAKAPAATAILGPTGLIEGYFRYVVGTRNPLELIKLWAQLVWWRPDVLVNVSASRGVRAAQRDAMFFQLCGVPQQIGAPVTVAMQENWYGAETMSPELEANLEPEAARLVRNLSVLGSVDLNDAENWSMSLTEMEQDAADKAIGKDLLKLPLIAVSVGTKVQVKDWGRENWHALLHEVAHNHPG